MDTHIFKLKIDFRIFFWLRLCGALDSVAIQWRCSAATVDGPLKRDTHINKRTTKLLCKKQFNVYEACTLNSHPPIPKLINLKNFIEALSDENLNIQKKNGKIQMKCVTRQIDVRCLRHRSKLTTKRELIREPDQHLSLHILRNWVLNRYTDFFLLLLHSPFIFLFHFSFYPLEDPLIICRMPTNMCALS